MLYRKNVFAWERAVRTVLGGGLASVPYFAEVGPAWPWVFAGIMLALTGIVGFCPACYAVGRKIPDFRQPQHG